MFFEGKVTCDHKLIQQWVSSKGGKPAVTSKDASQPGRLHICFPGCKDETEVIAIPWERFFEEFDREQLAFLYREVEGTADIYHNWQLL